MISKIKRKLTKQGNIPKLRQYHVKRNRCHCIHRHLGNRGVRHHRWDRVYNFGFKTQSGLHLKRTCLLLINLAVADLLGPQNSENWNQILISLRWAVQALGSSLSVMFLALILLQHFYAVFWSLRHGVTSTRTYIFSIVIVWVAGLCTLLC